MVDWHEVLVELVTTETLVHRHLLCVLLVLVLVLSVILAVPALMDLVVLLLKEPLLIGEAS